MEENPIHYISQFIYACIDWDDYNELLFNIRWLRKSYAFTGKFQSRISICAD